MIEMQLVEKHIIDRYDPRFKAIDEACWLSKNLYNRANYILRQNFTYLPHARFIDMLTYKAQLLGIKVIITEESYTSKCSFLDMEAIGKQERYAGRRVKRGLFRAGNGQVINADINAAFNIIRKVIPNAFADGIAAVVVQPVRVMSTN